MEETEGFEQVQAESEAVSGDGAEAEHKLGWNSRTNKKISLLST